MTLTDLLQAADRRERTLTVFDPPPSLVPALRDALADFPVVVHEGTAAGGPSGYAVLSEGDHLVTAVDVRGPEHAVEDAVDRLVAELRESFDSATFSAYDTETLLATTREIEDRAWRSGEGSLYAGFRTLERFLERGEVYRRLGETPLDVHVYAAADRGSRADAVRSRDEPTTRLRDPGGLTLHVEDDPEIADVWFVAFDGGRRPTDRCAILAERTDEAFDGFWTYDGDHVDEVVDHLRERYPVAP